MRVLKRLSPSSRAEEAFRGKSKNAIANDEFWEGSAGSGVADVVYVMLGYSAVG